MLGVGDVTAHTTEVSPVLSGIVDQVFVGKTDLRQSKGAMVPP